MFEDIYSFVVSGYVILVDAVGLMEKLQLDGNEYLRVVYGKSRSQSNLASDHYFRIYKVGNRRPIGNYSSEFFTLYFCSEELLLSEQKKISKSYKQGRQIASAKDAEEADMGIINDILQNELDVSPYKIDTIEETYGTYNFVIPRLKPLEAISWLSTYARPMNNKVGADMLFFQTSRGFNYRSLQSLYQQEPYATYKYQPKNVDQVGQKISLYEGLTSVLDFQYVKAFDTLHETSSGTYANRLISVDPLSKKYNITDFSYSDYTAKAESLNKNPVIGASQNKFGIKQTQAYDGKLKVFVSNANQDRLEYVKDKPGSVAKDIYAETFIPYRTAQIALANYTVLKLLIPGDSFLTAGKTINFNLYSLVTDQNENRQLDKYFSGKYLVTAVRHIIQSSGGYQTILEVAKESVVMKISAPDATSSEQQRVINEAY